jgi:regulator of protease activity HflC (stomatin/prohibitin superfamily)
MIKQAIEILLQFWRFFQFWTVLDAEFLGFVRRLGVPHRDLTPGVNWHWPFGIETIHTVDGRAGACICDPQTLTTVDRKTLLLRLKVSYCVINARKYELKVFEAGSNIQDVASGELGALVRDVPAADLFNGKALAIVSKRVRLQGQRWGMRVFDVEFVDYAECPVWRVVNSNFSSSGQE